MRQTGMWTQEQRGTEATPYLLRPDSSEGNRSRTEYESGGERYTGVKSTKLAVIMPRSAVQMTPYYRCGKEGHELHSCGFRETICHHCKKRSHLARVCRSKAPNVTRASGKASWRPMKGKRGSVKWLGMSMEKEAQSTEETEERVILQLRGPPSKPIAVEVEINGQSLLMEVDTDSAVSLIQQDTRRKYM